MLAAGSCLLLGKDVRILKSVIYAKFEFFFHGKEYEVSPHLWCYVIHSARNVAYRRFGKTWCPQILPRRWSQEVPVTYLLTPWSTVLLEKLTGSAASQEIPHIFGTRRFLTVLTSAHHLSLSWANSIQSPQPPPTSWRSILILSSHLRLGLPNGFFPSGFLWHIIKLRPGYAV